MSATTDKTKKEKNASVFNRPLLLNVSRCKQQGANCVKFGLQDNDMSELILWIIGVILGAHVMCGVYEWAD